MRPLLIALIALVIAMVYACNAEALDFTPTGSVLTVTYDEPTDNTDGTALNDLARTEIWHRLCPTQPGGCAGVPYTKSADVPATAPSGGGHVSHDITVGVPPGKENLVEVYAVAVDTSGNVSAESDHVTKRVDRLPPNRSR